MSNGLGQPLAFRLTPGQSGDIKQALPLLTGRTLPICLIADTAYDSDAFVSWLQAGQVIVVIPPNPTRLYLCPYDRQRYKQRNQIERLINKLKHNRRIATRYEKTALSFGTMLLLAFIRLWLNF